MVNLLSIVFAGLVALGVVYYVVIPGYRDWRDVNDFVNRYEEP